MAASLRQLFWPDLKNKSFPKTDAPFSPIIEKRIDARISVVIPENSVNATEKSGLMTNYYRLWAGISPDPEIKFSIISITEKSAQPHFLHSAYPL